MSSSSSAASSFLLSSCLVQLTRLAKSLPYILIVYVLVRLVVSRYKKRALYEAIAKIPGPPPRWPLIGNLDIFWDKYKGLNFTMKERLTALAVLYDKTGIFKLYIGQQPVVYLFKPDTVQAVLSNPAVIDKSHEYTMVECWLGKGLGTRNGDFWRTRRKILGPAFHFNILKDFIPIINEQSRVFCDVLAKKGDEDDISQLSINCALDIICETAMGVKLNTQNEPLNVYAKAIHRFTEVFVIRILSPWLWPNWIFFATPLGRDMSRQIKVLHNFTRDVIRNRKNDVVKNLNHLYQKVATTGISGNDENNNHRVSSVLGGSAGPPQRAYESPQTYSSPKKRLAFLDLLIKLHLEGVLTEEEVREEVDMFTFAGHDTTGISIAFAMFCIGLHPEVQEKLQHELSCIFGDDTERPVTAEDLRQLTYLECVLKESMRLYPAGPFFARQLAEEVTAGGHKLPKGTVVWLCILSLHLNEEVFPDAVKFDPERFSPAQTKGRHPYAYLPFSGGPRACLGQKFAMMEEKIIIANVLRKFNLRTLGTPDKLILTSEIILRPKSPITIVCTPR